MKTIIIVFLVGFIILAISIFLWTGYKFKDQNLRIEFLENKLAGMEIENEKLSLRIVEAEMKGWKHKAIIP